MSTTPHPRTPDRRGAIRAVAAGLSREQTSDLIHACRVAAGAQRAMDGDHPSPEMRAQAARLDDLVELLRTANGARDFLTDGDA